MVFLLLQQIRLHSHQLEIHQMLQGLVSHQDLVAVTYSSDGSAITGSYSTYFGSIDNMYIVRVCALSAADLLTTKSKC